MGTSTMTAPGLLVKGMSSSAKRETIRPRLSTAPVTPVWQLLLGEYPFRLCANASDQNVAATLWNLDTIRHWTLTRSSAPLTRL